MKKMKLLASVFIIFSAMFLFTNYIKAGIFDNIFSEGNEFWNNSVQEKPSQGNNASEISKIGTAIKKMIEEDIGQVIKMIGYLIFAIATCVLGLKYIWSGTEGKAQVKQTLPVFVVGILMFYLADTIFKLINNPLQNAIITNNGGDFENVQSAILGTIYNIVNMGAIAGIVFIGLKYMWASSEKKADIKNQLFPVLIGLVLVFASMQVVQLVINIGYAAMSTP